MRKLLLLGVALAAATAGAAKVVRIVILSSSTPSALTAADPTASEGYSLLASDLGANLSSFSVTGVWCELQSNSTITGGTLRWWKKTTLPDAGTAWGIVPGLDQSIGAIAKGRFVSNAVSVMGAEGRVYCQPSAVTESGADGGLNVTYGFRLESQ